MTDAQRMTGFAGARHPSFALARLESESMGDGRTILYFDWPDQPSSAADASAVTGSSAASAPAPPATLAPVDADPLAGEDR